MQYEGVRKANIGVTETGNINSARFDLCSTIEATEEEL